MIVGEYIQGGLPSDIGDARFAPFGPGLGARPGVAQSSIASIRPRTRLAVSGFSVQIGLIAFIISAVSISCTGNSTRTGCTNASSVPCHAARLLGERHAALCA